MKREKHGTGLHRGGVGSSEPTQALGIHACLRVASNLAAAGPTLLPVFRSRKSCRDLPVFSFPLEGR
ncbi:hypothetical protein CHARACLAT_011346 [Characodon lateralis]|uniref:Uncharacterized protein n=1 Tax=Characodon lateralis TaxID=208331 RepID=A0ABU7DZM4_9TELE|nr:hypothetical protein [Characodon lateralis]